MDLGILFKQGPPPNCPIEQGGFRLPERLAPVSPGPFSCRYVERSDLKGRFLPLSARSAGGTKARCVDRQAGQGGVLQISAIVGDDISLQQPM